MKIVLAHSDGLDTPVLFSWIRKKNSVGFVLYKPMFPFHRESQ